MLFLVLAISLIATGYLYKSTDVRNRAAGSVVNVPKRLAIFQGYLQVIQTDLNQFDVIVMPMGAEDPNDEDNGIVRSKVSGLKNSGKEVFGYVDMGVTTQNLTSVQAKINVDRWMAMGVTGIFWDNCGYDALNSRARQVELIDYTHSKGMKVFLNAKEPNDLFISVPAITFVSGDYYLYEDFLVANNVLQPLYTWQTKADKLVALGATTGVRMAVVTTATDEKYKTAAWWGATLINAYAFGYSYPGYGAKDIGADTLFTAPVVNSNFGTQFLDATITHSYDYRTHTRKTDKGIITLTGDGVTTLNGTFTAQVAPTSTPMQVTPTPTIKPTAIPTATPFNNPTATPTKVLVVPTATPTMIVSGGSTTNIIPNNSAETASSNASIPSSWDQDNWGSNSATFSYLSGGAHSGSRALKVQISSISDGDAKWTFNALTVTPGATYKFSDWYQSNVASQVVAYIINKDWSETYLDLTAAPASSGWAQYSTSFQMPSNAMQASIFHLIDKVGWLITDDYSLGTGTGTVVAPTATKVPTATPTKIPTATPTKISVVVATSTPTKIPTPSPTKTPVSGSVIGNIIPNNGVETVSSNVLLPSQWGKDRWGSNSTVFTYLSSGAYEGSRALKVQINSISSGDAKWTFNSIPVTAGAIYKFSDWYQSNINSRVVLFYINADGSEDYVEMALAPSSSTWKQYSTAFQVPSSAKTLSVFHLIDKAGWLMTDAYNLTR